MPEMPALTEIEQHLVDRLNAVLDDHCFDDLAVGATMDVLSRIVAAFLASSANAAHDEHLNCHTSADSLRVFQETLTSEFGAFALMLANQASIAAEHGPLDMVPTDVVPWRRTLMEPRDA